MFEIELSETRTGRTTTTTKRRISGGRETKVARESTSPLPTETIRVIETRARTYRLASRTFQARATRRKGEGVNGVGEEWKETGKDPSWQAQTVTLSAAGLPLAFLATRPALITPTPTKISRY